MRLSTGIRAVAGAVLAAGVAAPLIRRRFKLAPFVVTAAAAAAPFALNVLVPRSRKRDIATCGLQMWAYVVTYQMPNDDPEALKRRVKVDYPVAFDSFIGLGKTPTMRLQHAFGRPGELNGFEKGLIWVHWVWFMVPHASVGYLMLRRPKHFIRGACLIYGTFDLGALVYWLIPTAPPWYAAAQGRMEYEEHLPELRRMMVEYGEEFWKSKWHPIYGFLGGNPLAAMPSLHFGTSVMAARVLFGASPLVGTLAWSYALTLGVALVYLGEHYVIDLLAGAGLTVLIRGGAPAVTPAFRQIARGVRSIEARA